MKFKKVIKPNNDGQTYDLGEHVMKAGKKYVYYDVIQAARTDTEIYPCLERYGTIKPLETNYEQVYMDLRNINTDRKSLAQMSKDADNLWNSLDIKVREKFENNRDVFMRDGEKWLKSEMEKRQAKQETVTTTQTEGAKNE